MDGSTLLRRLRQLLDEDESATWMDDQTSYDYLYDAAVEFVDRTGCLRTTQDITTVADDQYYDLNPDFLRLYMKNNNDQFVVKFDDGTNVNWLTWKDYDRIYFDNNTTSVAIPSYFSIIDVDLPSQVTGTVTSTDAGSGGQSTLTDTAGDLSDVNAGAIVHNTTDSSQGIVLSKTSSTVAETALFGGTNNYWTSGDSYVIQPTARLQIVIDPPPSTASYTITVPYIQRPAPVYSDYGVYRFANPTLIIKYAFWLYKYRDREPNTGDAMYLHWEREVGKRSYSINRGQRPSKFKVFLKK